MYVMGIRTMEGVIWHTVSGKPAGGRPGSEVSSEAGMG